MIDSLENRVTGRDRQSIWRRVRRGVFSCVEARPLLRALAYARP
jgi:hypothetical protein